MPIVDPTGGMLTNAAGNIISAGFLAAASGVKNFVSESFDDDLAKFETEANRLKVLRDVNEELIRQNGTKTSSSCYQQWLSNVNDTLRRVEELKSELKQLSSSLFSNSGNRTDLFERVQQSYHHILVLHGCGEFQNQFLEDKPPKRVIKMNPPAIKMYPTLEKHLQEILQLVSCDDKVKTAGILGPFGVGKTTIMQHLNDCDQVAKLFDIVIWLKVSVPNKEKLQKQIARRLKVNWQDALHPDEIAESISEKLKDKKFLLLLDIDVKSRIDLRGIGIPDDIINGGSKVVFTTDFSRVHRSMADRVINVSALSADEAWLMFQQIVSSSDTLDGPGVKSVARLVAKECCGLPFLINQVASSFKWKVYSDEWRNGLEELRNWSKVDIPGLGDMHAFIKFCYDDLNDEQKQRCFLYGALHPVDTKISTDYLVKCWAAERFLGSIDDQRSFRTACDKGYAILRGLTDVSLLQPGRRYGHVQVNNVVRQVALHISSEESGCRFLVGKTRTSDVNGWGLAKRVFMIDTKLDHLPNPPSCCELLSLLLHKNPDLKTIPPSFFETMKMLLVLNLYRTGIETLPQSFECLNELKALFLNQCSSLTDLPLRTEKLSVLEVLDIRGSKVIFIPSAIGGLVSLRCLRVSYYKLRNVSPEEREKDGSVISRLSKLEELVIDVMSYDQWRIEAIHLIRHVASLDNLTCLKIHFPKLEDLQTLLESRREWTSRENLSLLWASIGRPGPKTPEISSYLEGKIERYLRYCPEGRGDHSITAANIFPETDAMELIGHNGITCLSQFMQVPGLVEVRDVLVVGCNNMATLVDDNVVGGGTNIQPKLHTIVVKSCPALTAGLIKHLATLKKLVINGCCSIEELFASSGVGSVQNLEVLELIDLPKLRAISEDASFECPQLKELIVGRCPELKKLPFNKQNAVRLQLIEGEQHWWDALQWDDEIKQHFQPTFKLG